MFLTNYLIEHNRYLQVLGIPLLIGAGILLSRHRSRIQWRAIAIALLLQILSLIFVLKFSLGQTVMHSITRIIKALYSVAQEGGFFIFGALTENKEPWGFIFALQIVPLIVFFGALMTVFYYLGVIRAIGYICARPFKYLLGISAAETLCALSNTVLGQTESTLIVKNYISTMTKSELFTVMVTGMATISAPLLAVYVSMGVPVEYVLCASLMAVPGAILFAKLIIPETEKSETAQGLTRPKKEAHESIFYALAKGTVESLTIALSVCAMLMAFASMLSLSNMILGFATSQIQTIITFLGFSHSIPTLTLGEILGFFLRPIGWLLGLTGVQAVAAAELIGIKLVTNEILAFTEMITHWKLTGRTLMLVTFALCNFTNLSSIGIHVATLSTLAPQRKNIISDLGTYAFIGAFLTNLLCACIAGILL